MLAVHFLDANIVWPNATWVQGTGTLDFSLNAVDNSTGLVDISNISNITLAVDVSNPEQGVSNQAVSIDTTVTCIGCKKTRTWTQVIVDDTGTINVDFSMATYPIVPTVYPQPSTQNF